MDKNISFTLKVWRQRDPKAKGAFETYQMKDIPGDTSFLEMLDILNEQLVNENKEPVAFDHDCREGICGMCSLYVNGHPHGPATGATTCQLYMRRFKDGDTITVEPWRSAGFPVIRDLMVDRTAFDKIQQAGGYVSINTGGMPDANAIPIGKDVAEEAMDAAACIGCGACVAACKNGSAMLFVSAKVSQFALLPQGKVEAAKRVKAMVAKMDELGFGNCTNTRACEAECPKCVSISNIARLNREFIKAKLKD
ncbi:MAG: succinate dehydrogenase/fumarate reductase iron-sulfur subunit [Bacteroidaceae bacterium]|nr:succinate dehydrogenase/fumarate reductase iron-sulfur subunit [Bacteroidaceae bacterium]